MCGNSAVFYLGYGEVPCDKFCRIKRRKKNDNICDRRMTAYMTEKNDSLLPQHALCIKTFFQMYWVGVAVSQSKCLSVFHIYYSVCHACE